MFERKYRIVRDSFGGFEAQYRPSWWPFWLQCSRRGGWGVNTHSTLDQAKLFVKAHDKGSVWEGVASDV